MRFLSVLTLAVITSCTSCQTAGKRSSSVKGVSKGEPTASPAPKSEFPNSYDEPITYLEIETTDAGVTVNVRTELQYMCERQCSKFKLVEEQGDGIVNYKAKRIPPVPGSDVVSRLAEMRQVRMTDFVSKKFVFKNVGKMDGDVVVNEILNRGQTHFLAVKGDLKPMLAIGGEAGYSLTTFESNKIDVVLEDPKIASQIPEGKILSGFFTGYLVTESKVERGDIPVFHVLTFETIDY